jgi:predicted nucleic acid-binding protein
MIILDTNIVSELMRIQPNSQVIKWLDQLNALDVFITSVTIAEIAYGIEVLPDSSKKNKLKFLFENAITKAFKQRICFFDEKAATLYGTLMGHRKNLGKPMSIPDGQIASITQVHQAFLATRNVKDFEYLDIKIINPFDFFD